MELGLRYQSGMALEELSSNKELLLTTQNQRTKSELVFKKSTKKWQTSGVLATENFAIKRSSYQNKSFQLTATRLFGARGNSLGTKLGVVHKEEIVLSGGDISSQVYSTSTLKQLLFIVGIEVNSNFLSYSVTTFSTKSKSKSYSSTYEQVNKVVLNLGRKYKYGLFFENNYKEFKGKSLKLLHLSNSYGVHISKVF